VHSHLVPPGSRASEPKPVIQGYSPLCAEKEPSLAWIEPPAFWMRRPVPGVKGSGENKQKVRRTRLLGKIIGSKPR